MHRLHARLEKLEVTRKAWWDSLSEAELEALSGAPGYSEFLDQQTMEALQQLADGDPEVTQEIWQGYLLWRGGRQ